MSASDSSQEGEISVSDAVAIAVQLHQRGELDAAGQIYQRVLAVWPECPDALHFSGLLELQRGSPERAAERIERSLRVAPEHADSWNNYGNVLKQLGRKDAAASAYERAIELRPNFPDALNNRGVMASQRGDFASAAEAYRMAIAVDAKHPQAHFNLGAALAELGMLDEAAEEYDVVTKLRPFDPEAYGRLGLIFLRQGKLKEATDAIVRNTEMAPGDPMAFIILAGILYEQGRIDESIEVYRHAVRLAPLDGYANRMLGMSLAVNGRMEEARAVWVQWAEADPSNPVPRHLVNVGADAAVPSRATDDFVARVFDGFAASFDKKLKDLEYHAPELVVAALRTAVGEPAAALEVLDAGCGTGLCAPLLRPFAKRLEGVDLSRGMLEKAKERGGYDELTCGELTAFMSSSPGAYDTIVSADTLCYFGELEGVFEAAKCALRPGGRFVFTIEKTVAAVKAEKCTLDHSGRYTHTESYVRSALEGAGLSVESIEVKMLRLEYFKPVDGLVIVVRKADVAS